MYLLAALSLLPFIASCFWFLPDAPSAFLGWILGAAKLLLLAAPVLCWKTLSLPGSWRDFGSYIAHKQPALKRQLVIGAGLGILAAGAILIIFHGLLSADVQRDAMRKITLKISSLNMKESFWFWAIAISFLHSLVEEFYWRFFIFTAWKSRLRPVEAHLVAGLAFTLHHVVVTSVYFELKLALILGLALWAGSLIWTYLFERERSLLGVWISHIIADLALMSIGFEALKRFAL